LTGGGFLSAIALWHLGAFSEVIPERTSTLEANEIIVGVVCTFSAAELVAEAHRSDATRIFDPGRHFQNSKARTFSDKSTGSVMLHDRSLMGALLFSAISVAENHWRAVDDRNRPCFALLKRFRWREPSCGTTERATSLLEQVSLARTSSGRSWPASELVLGTCYSQRREKIRAAPPPPADRSEPPR